MDTVSDVAVTNVSVTSLINLKSEDPSKPTSTSTTYRPPLMTESQSPEYCDRLAEVCSRANLPDALNILFQQEKTGRSTPVTPTLLYAAAKGRIDTKVAAGAVIVEAANFAAMACWEPPVSNQPPLTEEQFQAIARERPVFAQFARDIQSAMLACFGDLNQPHWKLSLMARDPNRKDKGAVRMVIEPFVKRAKEEKMPLVLVAGNTRARDVYAYFGFRVEQVLWSYPQDSREGDEGVPTWFMVCNWPVE